VANCACQIALASPGALRVTTAAAAASPNNTMLSGWRGLSERDVISLLYTSTLWYMPAATSCAAVCSPNMKLRQVALTSKHTLLPSGAPSSRCTSAAVQGMACCGPVDAPMIASRSPTLSAAASSARRAAAAPMPADVSWVA